MLNPQIAEVAINQGIELTSEMLAELHAFLTNYLPKNGGLLINKINSYSYSFETQQKIFSVENVKHFAVFTHNRPTQLAAESLVQFRQKSINLEFFKDFNKSLHWLCQQVDCPVPDIDPNCITVQ
ncbi:MAG: hypothetical protein JKX85_03795 [Phycisphaeraceae bacterium]|nr:hypothetical protein [Phycisphaeraceae bacterium]